MKEIMTQSILLVKNTIMKQIEFNTSLIETQRSMVML